MHNRVACNEILLYTYPQRKIFSVKIYVNIEQWEEVTETNGTQKSKESEEGEEDKKDLSPQALNTKPKIPFLNSEKRGFHFPYLLIDAGNKRQRPAAHNDGTIAAHTKSNRCIIDTGLCRCL